MTTEQQAAYVNGQVACAMIEAMGMQAENKIRELQGGFPPYGEDDFAKVIEEYNIHHNGVMREFQE